VVDLESHHTAFCRDCFFTFVERQAKRAIVELRMIGKEDRVLVASPGERTPSPLDLIRAMSRWTLHRSGDRGYSARSGEKVARFARERGLRTVVVSLDGHGIPIQELARRNRRAECSVCGTVKRHFFNKTAKEGGYDVVATGHNQDDEAGRLLGNLLHWQWEYLSKQGPVLPAVGNMLVKRVEPLCRLLGAGDRGVRHPQGDRLHPGRVPHESGRHVPAVQAAPQPHRGLMPGTKSNFYHGFLKNAELFRGQPSRTGGPVTGKMFRM